MRKQLMGGSLGLAVLLAVVACRGATAPRAQPVVIFSDDFTGPFPGTNWAPLPPPDSRGSSSRDSLTGNPRPSLALSNFCRQAPLTDPNLNACTPTASTVGSGVLSLAGSEGVTVTFDILLQPLTGGGSASADVSILSAASDFAKWAAIDVNLDKRTENYLICIHAAADCTSVEVPLLLDGRFHTYRLIVTATGSARWERDGVTQLSASLTFNGSFLIYLSEIGVDVPGMKQEYPVAYFDNVRVTQP